MMSLSCGAAMCIQSAIAAPIGVELVINGGAETGDTTGWIENGIYAYELNSGDVASQGFGNFAFTAGSGPAQGQTLLQTIDLSANSIDIDNSSLSYNFSAQLQSRSFQGVLDKAIAELIFKDENDNELNRLYFEDTINTALYDWNLYSSSDSLLQGTRSVDVLLTGTRSGFSSSDGFFDEISFSIQNISNPGPDPVNAPVAVSLVGFAMLFLTRLRRRKTNL